jgi:uncharacterized protein (TIGR00290 family)
MNNRRPTPILLSWSGGKDSALALHELRKSRQYEVVALLTTVTEGSDRVGMHAVRRSLIECQCESLGIPLAPVYLPESPSNREYEARLESALVPYRQRGVDVVAFGDLFLEDIRDYREAWLARIGMKGLYPIWRRDTARLAREFNDLGFKGILICVDTRALDRSFAGKLFDERLLRELPPEVDPCGENGEFHTFTFDGPIFARPIGFTIGATTFREPLAFCDLVPEG